MIWDRTNRPVWLRCAVGVLVAIIAAAIRLQFLEVLELRVTFVTFYPAVAVAALYGGFGPGLLATVVSAVLADYFWMEPVGQFAITNSADLISMVVFLASGTLISYLAETTYRAQARAKALEVQAKLAVEQEFHLFVSEVKDYAIFMLDTAGCVVSWNMGAEQIKGYQADEIIGRPHSCFYTPEDNARGWPGQFLQRAASEGRVEDEGWRVCKDGSRFWANVVLTALHDKEGSLRGFSKVTRDVTERKQAEEALREQREWLSVTLSSIGDAVMATDTKDRITFLNPIAAALTGWRIEEAVGQRVQNIFRIINEQTRQTAEDIVSRVLREGCIVALADHTALITRDAHEMPIADSAAPIRDGTGNVIGVVLVFHDVTEKRRTQDSLHESEERFRVMANSIPQLAWIAEADGYIFWYNQRWYNYTGTTPEQMEGWGWQSVHNSETLPGVLERWKGSISTGNPFDMVFPLRGADGIFREFLTRVEPVKNANGDVVQWCGTNTDISERKQLEEELRKSRDELEMSVEERTRELNQAVSQLQAANNELEAFSYSVSHDLRAPLRAIESFSHIIMEDYTEKLDFEGKEALAFIRDNTRNMGQLIDDLLAFSRLGRQEMRVAELDMAKMAHQVFSDLKLTAVDRTIDFHVGALPTAPGDPALIRQVFSNLIANAIKFTRPNECAVIEVEGRDNGNEHIYLIRDNGVGFDMKYVHKLFGVFQRLHSADEFEGTGVGLALVQRIVHRHGGRVWAEGKVGGGATFFFSLPAERNSTSVIQLSS
ncbi:MAG: PAS domain S-box protein [Syntrophobacteraceae bacterium]